MKSFKIIQFSKGTPKIIKEKLYDAYVNRDRVRLFYKKDYEDFSGYHDKTGLIHTCFIGCSTGTKPILLEISQKRSMGGGGLLTNCIEKIEVMEKKEVYV